MIRVCSVIGTWQLVTLVASLKQTESSPAEPCDDYLIMYETGGVPDEFKQILQRMAEATWPWKKIVWAYDLFVSDYDLTQKDYARLLRTIAERVGVAAQSVDEVWVCWLTRPAEKLLFGAFPNARIVLYEDGLISYLPIPLSERLPVPRALRARMEQAFLDLTPVRRFRHSRWELDPRHLARLSRAYLLLSPREPMPQTIRHVPRHDVADSNVSAVLKQIGQKMEGEIAESTAASAPGTAGRVLVLGQALSRNRIMSRADELAFYQSVVQTVLDKGYDVVWKEHPRISEPFFDDLQAFAARLGVPEARVTRLNLPHAFPVELVADKLNLDTCVAGTSAALFYLKRLYGISCYTFAGDLLPRMQGADVFMNDIVRRHIPPLTDLPPRRAQNSPLPDAPHLAEPPAIA